MLKSLKKNSISFLSALSTGFLAALGFAFMSSGKISNLPAQTAAEFSIFVVYQSMLLTISKAGMDTFVFSHASNKKNEFFLLNGYALKTVIPLAFLALLFLRLGSSPISSIAAMILITVLDVIVLVRNSEFAKKEMYNSTVAISFLKYPLFFLVVIVISEFKEITFDVLLVVIVFSSIVRFLFVHIKIRGANFIDYAGYGIIFLTVQQFFNYLLFKLDIILIPYINLGNSDGVFNDLPTYIVINKFTEIASSVYVVFGGFFFPKLYQANIGELANSRTGLFLCLLHFAFAYVAVQMYCFYMVSYSVSPVVQMLISISCVLGLVANFITYIFIAESNYVGLIVALFKSILFSFPVFIYSFETESLRWMYSMVPIQMSFFLFFSLRNYKINVKKTEALPA